jgi:hypothetical protein
MPCHRSNVAALRRCGISGVAERGELDFAQVGSAPPADSFRIILPVGIAPETRHLLVCRGRYVGDKGVAEVHRQEVKYERGQVNLSAPSSRPGC